MIALCGSFMNSGGSPEEQSLHADQEIASR